LRSYGHLPSSIKDPFKGTSFIRLDNVEDDDFGLTEENSLKELDDEGLAQSISML